MRFAFQPYPSVYHEKKLFFYHNSFYGPRNGHPTATASEILMVIKNARANGSQARDFIFAARSLECE